MNIAASGYGAGSRDFPGQPNVVRLTIGEHAETQPAQEIPEDTVTVLEANLDDLNPQVFGYVMERLLAEGALDVFGTPVQMKKNRPGMLLTRTGASGRCAAADETGLQRDDYSGYSRA